MMPLAYNMRRSRARFWNTICTAKKTAQVLYGMIKFRGYSSLCRCSSSGPCTTELLCVDAEMLLWG